jgi:hypothetical protein
VVEAGSPGIPQRLARNQGVRPVDVVHPAVEIVGAAAVEHGAGDPRGIVFEGERAAIELDIALNPGLRRRRAVGKLVRLPPPALPADRRDGRLYPLVAAGEIHREVAPHRVAVDPQPIRIDLGLPFEKGEAPAAAECEQIPVVVLGMLTVFVKLQRAGQQRGIALHIALRGIDGAPIGVGLPGLGVLDGIDRPIAPPPTAPVDRQRRVAPIREKLDFRQRRPLAAAVNVHHGRELSLGRRGKAVDRGHPGRRALEVADEKPNVAIHPTVLPPLPDHLRLERILLRVEVGPERLDRLRHRVIRHGRS